RLKTHSARIFASSSVTGLAGIGIGPQTPALPFLILRARVSTAPSTPAFLAATSFRAGPTILLSTVWQATHGLLLNSVSPSVARAGCTANAAPRANIGIKIFFIVVPQG